MMKSKRIFTKRIFTLFYAVCFLFFGVVANALPSERKRVLAEELSVSVEKIELPDDESNTIIFYLSQTDFITAEFDETDNTAAKYKWVDSLAYENREQNNVCNALLDKNLSEYNYGDYFTIDGVAIKNYNHELRANKFQRIEGLGLTFFTNVLQNATEIYIKAGCSFPTLARGYFNVEEPSALVIEEDTIYRKREGQWVKAYPFDGYQENVIYDASERFFYKRSSTASFQGHPEAPTCEISNGYKPVGDEDFVLCSSTNTLKGNLLVIDFVNPIDSTKFGKINLRFYVHEPRTMVSYNANGVSPDSLGEILEEVTLARGWTYASLMLPLYANEDGLVDRIVFKFTNDGDLVNSARNQVGIGEFNLSSDMISTLLYDKSLIISETQTDYHLSFRFNKKGDFNSDKVDYSKFCINGESLADINASGEYVSAKWISLQGIYQINVVLSKNYQGEGQIKNADIGYACNKISVINGLQFPNGDLLDRTYHYNLYRNFTDNLIFENEVVIDYEISQTYKETKVNALTWEINEDANGNLEFLLYFDKKITNRMINHVCEPESWREALLGQNGLYDESYTSVFIAGGYKSSLFDSILINGQSIGEFHARNNHQTCVFVHYGQGGFNTLIMCIDSHAPDYQELKDGLLSGEGVNILIKSGFKFTTGVKTTQDYCFNLQNGVFVLEQENPQYTVYFEGKPVTDGQTLKVDYKALPSSVFVSGTSYQVESVENGNVTTFTVKYANQQITFQVEQSITKSPESAGGCTSFIYFESSVLLLLSAIVISKKRGGNKYE